MSKFAAVFVRRNGASNLGHVAYGFQTNNGQVCYGSIEGFAGLPIAPPSLNKVWNKTEAESGCINTLLSQGYSECKLLAGPGNEAAARQMMSEWSKKGYYLLGQNCAFAVYHILTSFGCYPPTPWANLAPNNWYDSYITSTSHFLQQGKSIFGNTHSVETSEVPMVYAPDAPILEME